MWTLLSALLLTGCSPHTLGSTEVGVKTQDIALLGSPGVLKDVYPSGSTVFVPWFLNSWYVFDIGVQNLAMTADPNSGARPGDDALQFKTQDGSDIAVDITVTWRIDPAKVPYIVQFVGASTPEVEERLVRPVTRTLLRDVLNDLRSEEYYDGTARFKKADEARDACNLYLQSEGVIIDQILLGQHRFNAEYEQVIKDKTLAEQEAAQLRSESDATRAQMLRDLEVAKGEVNQSIEQARGKAQQKQLEADASYIQRQAEAEALLAEAHARTEGLKAQAKALSGAGGRNMVKIKVAEALTDKPILFLPTGGMDVKTTDMNQLLQTYGVQSLSSPTP